MNLTLWVQQINEVCEAFLINLHNFIIIFNLINGLFQVDSLR